MPTLSAGHHRMTKSFRNVSRRKIFTLILPRQGSSYMQMIEPILTAKQADALSELVAKAENIVITTHMSPDGDAMGSSLGLAHVLTYMGKTARVVVPDDPSKQLTFLPGAKETVVFCRYQNFAEQLIADADLIFCLDYNGLKRIDRMAKSVAEAKAPKVMIDHHIGPEEFCDITISHHEMSSTCMLLFIVLCNLEFFAAIDTDAANCILAGMMTDTGNFSYNANDPAIYTVVSRLIEKGADKNNLSRRLFDTFSEWCLRINGYAVSKKMEVWKEYGAALITLSRDELNRFHYTRGDTEGLVNRPLAIPGIVYSVFLREEERYIKVSMRSVGDFPCDVVCSRYFGGGGHKNAAGGEFRGSMQQCIDVFKSLLQDNAKLIRELPDTGCR